MAVAAVEAFVKTALAPSTYTTTFAAGAKYVSETFILKGRMAEPIVGFMVTVGFTGYMLEYLTLGRYHVAHKKAKIEAALKEYDERHGGHH
mmetsp:Transcript_3942/g.12107  ORF Transcript_3942/g.12107 Transcript_3942/m.12107 type:complete len:91 (+) Transcript_3942:38-310(+)|eukprot:CAMPEP_0197387112 /NCGR_PEP_ID=MMETSP1165-20131217/325_1 /TAXON_ID=284809 /ORGANISM="Chrysocystis fragilis, Strain CCMP3189" /LENGTH=90 /DNA_ID=CAMNT_0042912413 /DNA_START=25 /DNA_END=297 /DNA_ORIENTATION=+